MNSLQGLKTYRVSDIGHLSFYIYIENQRYVFLARALPFCSCTNETNKLNYTTMDRTIPEEVQRKKRRRRMMMWSGGGVGFFALVIVGAMALQPSVSRSSLSVSTADVGTLQISINAAGTVAPAYEEIINSPLDTRVVEVYKKPGDSVKAGQPLLKLDLQTASTDYNKLLDEEQMRQHQMKQLEINNETKLKDLAMQIRVSEMKLNRMAVELRNEQFLDSLGAGTPDKVRQVELNYKVSKLEHEQLCQQYANEQKVMAAEEQVKALDLSIFRKGVAEMKRTLEEAQVFAPRDGVLTFLNDQIGVRVAKGEQLATVADLSRFQVKGTIADSYIDRVSQGAEAIVKVGDALCKGVVNHVVPTSEDGTIDFTVQLEKTDNGNLRSGLKVDVHVIYGVKDNVLRIANDTYYLGAGKYELFVMTDDNHLERREVELGESSWDYVEVISGLKPGDRVVVSDMNAYKGKSDLKIK